MATSIPADQRIRAFISYSRADIVFAQGLVSALEDRGIAITIDTRDLPKFEEWRRELLNLIESADAVIFIISSSSIASPVCAWEVEQVASLNKRLAPIVLERVADDRIPASVSKINYLFFDDPTRFDSQADLLAKALQSDHAWLKEHTRLGALARRWEVAQTNEIDSYVLRGGALNEAELWISRQPRAAPEPTELHRKFILESRKAEQARSDNERQQIARTRRFQRRSAIALFLVATLVVGGLIAAISQSLDAQRREAIVMTSLANRAVAEENYDGALRLAVHGLPKSDRIPFLSLDWQSVEMQRLAAKLVGAASLSPIIRNIDLASNASPPINRWVRAVALNSDGGKIVAGLQNGIAEVVDAKTGNRLIQLKGHGGAITSVAFSLDGLRILTGSEDALAILWDAGSGEKIKELRGHSNVVAGVAFSADGQRIATSSWDHTARIWDAASGRVKIELNGHTGNLEMDRMESVAFSPDGKRIVTSSWDSKARVWDASSGKLLLDIPGHRFGVYSAQFSPDGRHILTGSDDNTARVWVASTGTLVLELRGHSDRVRSASYSPDGTRIATGSADGTVRIWKAENAELVRVLKGHIGPVSGVSFGGDSRTVATSSFDGFLRLWDTRVGEPAATMSGVGSIRALAFSSDGTRMVSVSGNESDDKGFSAQIWNVNERRILFSLITQAAPINSATFSRDGRWIALGSGDIHTAPRSNKVQIWNVETGSLVKELGGFEFGVNSVAFSLDGQFIAVSALDSVGRVIDWSGGKVLRQLVGHADAINGIVYSSDGRRLATASNDNTVIIWNGQTGARELTLDHGSAVNVVAFSSDDRFVGGAAWNSTARVWDVSRGLLVTELKGAGMSGQVRSIAFSADGNRVATGSDDKMLRVWDTRSGELIGSLNGHGLSEASINTVTFGGDGKNLASGSTSGTIHIWGTDWFRDSVGGDLVRRVCREKLIGDAGKFGGSETEDPILKSFAGRNVCERSIRNSG